MTSGVKNKRARVERGTRAGDAWAARVVRAIAAREKDTGDLS